MIPIACQYPIDDGFPIGYDYQTGYRQTILHPGDIEVSADSPMREQSYQYFRQEAPELLQEMEDTLFAMQDSFSVQQMHALISAHTHIMEDKSTAYLLVIFVD